MRCSISSSPYNEATYKVQVNPAGGFVVECITNGTREILGELRTIADVQALVLDLALNSNMSRELELEDYANKIA